MEFVMTCLVRLLRRKEVSVAGMFLFSICGSVYFSFSSTAVWKHEWIMDAEPFLPIYVPVFSTTTTTTTSGTDNANKNPSRNATHYQSTTQQHPFNNTANTSTAEKIFYVHHLESINSLVNISTALAWKARWKNPFLPFKEALENPVIIPWGKVPQDFVAHHLRDKSQHIIVWRDICAASQAMVAYRNSDHYQPHPHILVTRLNENWGEFSTLVPNRTTDDKRWTGLTGEAAWEAKGCTLDFILDYINHKDTRAVVTTQHQLINHPKVHSLPLGIMSYDPDLKKLLYELRNPSVHSIPAVGDSRSQLLMVNCKPRKMRVHVLDVVIQNFRGTVQNTYQSEGNYRNYLAELRNSKFILSPSGMGLDCYRHWEALYMGTIPVLEHFNRSDGMYRNFDDLPVVWIDHYENLTPEFLEEEYKRIVAQAGTYNYEKLTRQWWIHKINSTLL
jgi:hypothetical protein